LTKFSVFDNFLPAEDFGELSSYLMSSASWSFSGRSRDADDPSFWFHPLGDISLAPFKGALARRNFEVGTVLAFYANGQSSGQDGQFHRDAKDRGIYTCLLYANRFWRDHWGGATLFKDDEVLHAHDRMGHSDGVYVLPVPNRAVVFPADLVHVGMAPTGAFKGLRVTVALKFSTHALGLED